MNIYYSPEEYGLEVVFEKEAGRDYDFDMFVVWRDPDTGQLYWGEDAGCSCPSPFEGYGYDDLRTGDVDDLLRDYRSWLSARTWVIGDSQEIMSALKNLW